MGKKNNKNNKQPKIKVKRTYNPNGKDINELMVQYVENIMTLKAESRG